MVHNHRFFFILQVYFLHICISSKPHGQVLQYCLVKLITRVVGPSDISGGHSKANVHVGERGRSHCRLPAAGHSERRRDPRRARRSRARHAVRTAVPLPHAVCPTTRVFSNALSFPLSLVAYSTKLVFPRLSRVSDVSRATYKQTIIITIQ